MPGLDQLLIVYSFAYCKHGWPPLCALTSLWGSFSSQALSPLSLTHSRPKRTVSFSMHMGVFCLCLYHFLFEHQVCTLADDNGGQWGRKGLRSESIKFSPCSWLKSEPSRSGKLHLDKASNPILGPTSSKQISYAFVPSSPFSQKKFLFYFYILLYIDWLIFQLCVCAPDYGDWKTTLGVRTMVHLLFLIGLIPQGSSCLYLLTSMPPSRTFLCGWALDLRIKSRSLYL